MKSLSDPAQDGRESPLSPMADTCKRTLGLRRYGHGDRMSAHTLPLATTRRLSSWPWAVSALSAFHIRKSRKQAVVCKNAAEGLFYHRDLMVGTRGL